MSVKFDVGWRAASDTIFKIVDRAHTMASACGQTLNKMHMTMDVLACHANGCPLRLADLLAADDFDFAHDVFGIERHIDRRTGKLGDCFVPRYARSRRAAAGSSLDRLRPCT